MFLDWKTSIYITSLQRTDELVISVFSQYTHLQTDIKDIITWALTIQTDTSRGLYQHTMGEYQF